MTALADRPTVPATTRATPGRLRRAVRGRPDDPVWVRPGLLGLLTGTAVLYLVGLGASGWANSFYSAAAQAASVSWKAFFFGSSDAGNAITVDKPPAALWLIDVSVRLFGLSSWSILVPQALCGVAAAGLLYATVRRVGSPGSALLAGGVLALTPVAVLMFRFDNPDALLVLLLTAAAYAGTRALERGRTGWLLLAGSLVGLGFLTKMSQALLVLPAFGPVYLCCAPVRLRRRIGQVLAAGAALVLAGGWWVAVVQLWPVNDRPYIGGSQHNSVLELLLGYNGFGRLTGDETGGLGDTSQDAGIGRLLGSEMGGQIGWLLPAALIGFAALLWLTRRAPRTDATRSAALLWGGWLLVTGAVFSFAQGILHPYYTVALAPAIGALTGLGVAALWRHRQEPVAAGALAGGVALTGVTGWLLLDRTPDWLPWLRYLVLVGCLAAAVLLLFGTVLPRRVAVGGAVLAVLLGLAGPSAYAVRTAGSPHRGAIPSAGPASGFGPGGTGRGGGPGGAAPGARGGFGGGARGGGMAGLLDGSTPGAALTALLKSGTAGHTWVAATVGSNNAAGYQLAGGGAVLAVGGYNGTDPSPTLAQFQEYVAQGRIHYFLGGSGTASAGDTGAQIAAWVAAHHSASTVDGVLVYDLSAR